LPRVASSHCVYRFIINSEENCLAVVAVKIENKTVVTTMMIIIIIREVARSPFLPRSREIERGTNDTSHLSPPLFAQFIEPQQSSIISAFLCFNRNNKKE
jgi:hypothetical protein